MFRAEIKELGARYERILLDDTLTADTAYTKAVYSNITKEQNRLYIRAKYLSLLRVEDEEKKKEYLSWINWEDLKEVDDTIILFLVLAKVNLAKEIKANRELLEGVENEVLTRKALNKLIEKGCYVYTEEEKLKIIADIVFAFTKGMDLLQPLLENGISEVGFRRADYVYMLLGEETIRLEFLRFKNPLIPRNLMGKEVPTYGQSNPMVVRNNEKGDRITVAGEGVVADYTHLYYNQRMFADEEIKELGDLVTLQTISEDVAMMLRYIVWSKSSYIISGSATGLGKSTLLRTMVSEIPNNTSIGLIDTNAELNISNLFPAKNIITLLDKGGTKLGFRQLFDGMLKQSVKQVLVGEIITPEHIDALIDAWLRLSCGGGGTFHSITAEEVVNNLVNKAVATPTYYREPERASEAIANALQYIVHLERHPTDRARIIVKKILKVEVSKYEVEKGPTQVSRIKSLIEKALKKYIAPAKYKYTELVGYKEEEDTWHINTKEIDVSKIASRKKREEIQRWVSECNGK